MTDAKEQLLSVDKLALYSWDIQNSTSRESAKSIYKFQGLDYPNGKKYSHHTCMVTFEITGPALGIHAKPFDATGYSLQLFGTQVNKSQNLLDEASKLLRQGNKKEATEKVCEALKELVK